MYNNLSQEEMQLCFRVFYADDMDSFDEDYQECHQFDFFEPQSDIAKISKRPLSTVD